MSGTAPAWLASMVWLLKLLVNSYRLITYKGGGPPQQSDFPGL